MEEHLETEKSSSILNWLESVSTAANSQLNLDDIKGPASPLDRLNFFPPVPRPSLPPTVSSSA